MPRSRHSLVTFTSFRFFAAVADEIRAGRIAVITFDDRRHIDIDDVPSCSLVFDEGMPWQTTSFTEVQMDFG